MDFNQYAYSVCIFWGDCFHETYIMHLNYLSLLKTENYSLIDYDVQHIATLELCPLKITAFQTHNAHKHYLHKCILDSYIFTSMHMFF